VPLLTAANWGGQGLHLRGNFEGYLRAATSNKWLEAHGLEHWTEFYTDYGINLQKRFFDHFLKGEDNGWDNEPRVRLQVRYVDHFEERVEDDWPIPRTQWTRLNLDPAAAALTAAAPNSSAAVSFDARGDGLTFFTEPMAQDTEITGPAALDLVVSSSTTDADLFVVLGVFDPDGEEVTFQGAIDPHTPIGQGWLRASHRKLDEALSTAWRPYHSHDEPWPLTPGNPESLQIEIWPTCIVVPAGHRVGLTVRGRDYEYAHTTGARLSNFKNELKGCGPFLHDDPRDRPTDVFGGQTTLHLGPEHNNFLLLPIIPHR
jgi:predicted acyl esterase